MAVVNSVVIGRGRKSVGEVTLRHDRGRTIAARRITINNSKTTRQTAQRTFFKVAQGVITYNSPIIDICYGKSKYGSARNNFFSRNYQVLKNYWFFKEELGPRNPLYWGPTAYPYLVGNPQYEESFGDGLQSYVTYSEGGKSVIDSSIRIDWGKRLPPFGIQLRSACSSLVWDIPMTEDEFNACTVTAIIWPDLSMTDSGYNVIIKNVGLMTGLFTYNQSTGMMRFHLSYDEINSFFEGNGNNGVTTEAPYAGVFAINVGGKIAKTTTLIFNDDWTLEGTYNYYKRLVEEGKFPIQQFEAWQNFWNIDDGKLIETPSQMIIQEEGAKDTERGYVEEGTDINIPRASKKRK